jgi:sugar/nucleoside kinase (ribokinase family)
MNTYLGVSAYLGPDDVDPDIVAQARVVYLEGYLWDRPEAKEAYRKAARIAHEAGHEVSLTLSDSFCVDRHRAEWLSMIADEVDILFANEAELCSLYECDFDRALAKIPGHCKVAAVTRSEKGSMVICGEQIHTVDAFPTTLVDTTGAGDLYAAGFLYAYTQGLELDVCATVGSLAASEVISHLGARPEADLAALAKPYL